MPLEYQAIKKSFDRAAPEYERNAILQREVLKRLLERLEDEQQINAQLKPQHILDLGCGTGWAGRTLLELWPNVSLSSLDFCQSMLDQVEKHQQIKTILADVHNLPLPDNNVDVVFSNMMLHWSNETDVFKEALRVLKPGGLLLMSCLGETSLFELKQACAVANNKFQVHKFSALHDLGDNLLKTGFQDVVVNAEVITLTYQDVQSLMKDIKASGGQNVNEDRHKGLVTASYLSNLAEAYEAFRHDGKLPASYEIVYLRAKKAEVKEKILLNITA